MSADLPSETTTVVTPHPGDAAPRINPMRFPLPLTPGTTTPLHEAAAFGVLAIALTWLFWLPGALVQSDFLLALGSIAPLAVALFLDLWLRERSFPIRTWLTRIPLRAVVLALLIPVMLLTPSILFRIYISERESFDLSIFVEDLIDLAVPFLILFAFSLAEEAGWRSYLLPRLKAFPLFLTNVLVATAWFFWQLPLILAGRYNTFDELNTFVIAMFIFTLAFTPFLNRMALRSWYSPLPSAVLRASLLVTIQAYIAQGRAEPLTDWVGTLTLFWLAVLNVLLFGQLWLGRKAPADTTELERVMPLDVQ
jgi:hypothetical protein